MENSGYRLRNRKIQYIEYGIILLLLGISVGTLGSVSYASRDGDEGDGNYGGGGSIVGGYADGYELGKERGIDDWRSGNPHNSKCPPNDSLAFCTGYKVGYEAGWFLYG